MSNFRMMYFALVDEISNTIDGLTAILQKAEDIYIESIDDSEIERSSEDEKKATTLSSMIALVDKDPM